MVPLSAAHAGEGACRAGYVRSLLTCMTPACSGQIDGTASEMLVLGCMLVMLFGPLVVACSVVVV